MASRQRAKMKLSSALAFLLLSFVGTYESDHPQIPAQGSDERTAPKTISGVRNLSSTPRPADGPFRMRRYRQSRSLLLDRTPLRRAEAGADKFWKRGRPSRPGHRPRPIAFRQRALGDQAASLDSTQCPGSP